MAVVPCCVFRLLTMLVLHHSDSEWCYVLVERSARLELDGYDSVVWHVALEACASSIL